MWISLSTDLADEPEQPLFECTEANGAGIEPFATSFCLIDPQIL